MKDSDSIEVFLKEIKTIKSNPPLFSGFESSPKVLTTLYQQLLTPVQMEFLES
jgi:hypothetical protein